MEQKFELAITLDYGRVLRRSILRLILVMLLAILFAVSLEMGLISPLIIQPEFVIPLSLLLVFAATLLVLRKTYFTGTITLGDDSMEIPEMGKINYQGILKVKTFTFRGFTSCIITLADGGKVAVGPANNFSTAAGNVFWEFISELGKKVEVV